MIETISLDSKTVILKSDNETDITEIINLIIKRDKNKKVASFLQFASQNRVVDKKFKFNRDECYDR
jgi:uncharacterized protein YukJ